MNVIVLTVFIGLILVFLFLFLFVQQFSKKGAFSPDRDSLLPLKSDDGIEQVRNDVREIGNVLKKDSRILRDRL